MPQQKTRHYDIASLAWALSFLIGCLVNDIRSWYLGQVTRYSFSLEHPDDNSRLSPLQWAADGSDLVSDTLYVTSVHIVSIHHSQLSPLLSLKKGLSFISPISIDISKKRKPFRLVFKNTGLKTAVNFTFRYLFNVYLFSLNILADTWPHKQLQRWAHGVRNDTANIPPAIPLLAAPPPGGQLVTTRASHVCVHLKPAIIFSTSITVNIPPQTTCLPVPLLARVSHLLLSRKTNFKPTPNPPAPTVRDSCSCRSKVTPHWTLHTLHTRRHCSSWLNEPWNLWPDYCIRYGIPRLSSLSFLSLEAGLKTEALRAMHAFLVWKLATPDRDRWASLFCGQSAAN